MPRGDWDDISPAQKKALRALCATATGAAYAGNLRRYASLATLRSLHRYGLVKADQDVIQHGTVVTITESGRDSAKDWDTEAPAVDPKDAHIAELEAQVATARKALDAIAHVEATSISDDATWCDVALRFRDNAREALAKLDAPSASAPTELLDQAALIVESVCGKAEAAPPESREAFARRVVEACDRAVFAASAKDRDNLLRRPADIDRIIAAVCGGKEGT